MRLRVLHLLAAAVLLPPSLAPAQPVTVPVAPTVEQLLKEEDTDGDELITIEDRGDRRFTLRAADGRPLLVEGVEPLTNLLQELTLAERSGATQAALSGPVLYQNTADRVSHLIRAHYWDWLTRTIDAEGLERLADDPKLAGHAPRIYIPHRDERALRYYSRLAAERPALRLEVVRLPQRITPEYVRSINTAPGLLAMALNGDGPGARGQPFVVPGGRFNEMYGWDSYFTALGLLADGRIALARSMVDNFVYQIEHYGKILNANRTYYLTRSQPPFLTSMALAVHDALPPSGRSREWLARAMRAAIREYEEVWTGEGHMTETGLSRYHGFGTGIPPEVEPGHFDPIIAPLAAEAGLSTAEFTRRYEAGDLKSPQLDDLLRHDRAMRESGHDTSYRMIGRAADLNTVALNSLLFRIERDLAETIAREFGGALDLGDGRVSTPEVWDERARRRARLMQDLMWDDDRALFFDYDFTRRERLDYTAATTLYPLWAGLVPPDQARRLARAALAELEQPGGIVASTEASRGPVSAERPLRQWDYPYGWAPHQVIAWHGLMRYGLREETQRLAYRWTHMIAMNAARHGGAVVEKYDVAARTIDASAEYGNVGTRFRRIPEGGFGWTNASYQVGLGILTPEQRAALARLVPPEWVFR